MIRTAMLAWTLAAFLPAHATTVTRASLDDLIQKSTSIVRGRVVGSSSGARGSLVYTYYKIQLLDCWKGTDSDQVQVQVPGGSFNGIQQNIAGAPQLTEGSEYVFFLWTGPSQATHLLGLSQGVLDVVKDASGAALVVRQASEAQAFDSATGATASQDPLQMKLSDFSSRVAHTLKGVGSSK
jgi:hypothetical protein